MRTDPTIFSLAVVVTVFFWRGGQAGSPAWESAFKPQPPHPVERLDVDEAGYAVRDNVTHDVIVRRYMSILPGNSPAPENPWPDRTIRYCFEDELAKSRMQDILDEAIRLWQDAGLLDSVYTYDEVTGPGAGCTGHPQRAQTLVIRYNNQGRLRSTIGLPAADGLNPDLTGPYMDVTDDPNVGMLSPTASIAHELGHVWGLYHEHQNRFYWVDGPYRGEIPEGNDAFGDGLAVFNCAALSDYAAVMQRIDVAYPGQANEGVRKKVKEDVCQDINMASLWNFDGARSWLPRTEMNIHMEELAYSKVDWSSIMLYPSGNGGLGNAAPPPQGQPQGVNDHRQAVLLKADGQRIEHNLAPSERDVLGIRKLYGDEQFPQGVPTLPNDKKHKFYAKLGKLFGRGNKKSGQC
ncbi:hypothetical protein GE09DRAFT_1217824 [Coniochaeta sp. 2T2.1]|nr:hypothetical protein GE09DRAFT_1217824 [Coniochaeta sp. 2T2.1]